MNNMYSAVPYSGHNKHFPLQTQMHRP